MSARTKPTPPAPAEPVEQAPQPEPEKPPIPGLGELMLADLSAQLASLQRELAQTRGQLQIAHEVIRRNAGGIDANDLAVLV